MQNNPLLTIFEVKKMYKQQKGFVPLACSLLGLLIFVWPTFVATINMIYELFEDLTFVNFVLSLLAELLVLWLPLWLSFFLLKIFPSIKILDKGIKIFSFPLSINLIKWEEIESIIRFRNGYSTLVFRKTGIDLYFNFHFNKFYGLIMQTIDPVIFIAPNIFIETDLIYKLKEKGISVSGFSG